MAWFKMGKSKTGFKGTFSEAIIILLPSVLWWHLVDKSMKSLDWLLFTVQFTDAVLLE